MTKSLVNGAIEWDHKDNINKAPKDRESKHLTDLIDTIQACGVSFNVWEKKNADGKSSGVYDFTSLTGSDKKRLLKNLPEKLKNTLNTDANDSVVKLWEVLDENEDSFLFFKLYWNHSAKSRLEYK